MKKAILFLVAVALACGVAQACIVQWLNYNEAFISLKHVNQSIQLEPIRNALGDGLYTLNNSGITYWSIDGSNVGIMVEEKQALFQSYDAKSLYELEYVLNYSSSEIQDTLREYRALLSDICYINLNWIRGLNATDLSDLDVDQACSQLDYGNYVDYGHQGSEEDHWLGVQSNCVVNENLEVMCYRCGGGGTGLKLDLPTNSKINISQQTTTTMMTPATTILSTVTSTTLMEKAGENVVSAVVVVIAALILAAGLYYGLVRK